MSKLLYIQASPRSERSHSLAVADAFIDEYKSTHPDDEIVTINVFDKVLPPFDEFALNAKYAIMHGQSHSDKEKETWKKIVEILEEFNSGDTYVMAVPMWNFGIPYRLKQYLDIIVQPTYTFSYSPEEGYKGLVLNKPLFIAYARGGDYPEGTDYDNLDFQKRYLQTIMGFIGFSNIHSVIVQPTEAHGKEIALEKRARAIEQARELARNF